MTDIEALIAFLRAQLDEDAEVATAAAANYNPEEPWYDEGAPTDEQEAHADRWDPARVLAEVEAKRARIDLLAKLAAKCPEDDWPDEGGMELAPLADMARHLIKLEAQPLADRPGFKPEWRLA